MLSHIAQIPFGQLAFLAAVIVSFCAFGLTLFIVSISTTLSQAEAKPAAEPREVIQARRASSALR
jgi:hypothetical protein